MKLLVRPLHNSVAVAVAGVAVAVAERNRAAAIGHPGALWTGWSTPSRRSAKKPVPETS
jgi:hypothetical protein